MTFELLEDATVAQLHAEIRTLADELRQSRATVRDLEARNAELREVIARQDREHAKTVLRMAMVVLE